MFNHRFRYIFIGALAVYAYLNTLLCSVYDYFQINIEWYLAFLTISGITLLSWEGNRIIEKPLRKRIGHSPHNVKFLAAFFIAGNVVTAVAVCIMIAIVGYGVKGYGWDQNANPLKLNLIYGGLVNLLFHLINTIFQFFREKEKYWKQAEELRKITGQAELQLIRNQINPHFLFNNLNVLSAMVIRDNPDANRFIERFSSVYRHVLNNQDKELVLLSSELDFIESYVYLLQKRFPGGLQVLIDIPDQFRDFYVVPAALQMLVENAIKHNVVASGNPLSISIHVNGGESLVVSNNIQLRQTVENSTRLGLANIHKRYFLISGRDVEVIKNEKEFKVVLPLLNLN